MLILISFLMSVLAVYMVFSRRQLVQGAVEDQEASHDVDPAVENERAAEEDEVHTDKAEEPEWVEAGRPKDPPAYVDVVDSFDTSLDFRGRV